jgi:ABC-type multidrug transport system ATPase subunit
MTITTEDNVSTGTELVAVGPVDVEANIGAPRPEPIVSRSRSETYSPDIPDNAPIVVSFADLSVTAKKTKKAIIKNISGSITGGFWAIMGASGSGKTTLLSALSLRLDSNYMEITGERRLNGHEYNAHLLKKMSGYVMQDDLLHAELTAQEALHYAACLRMPPGTTEEEMKAREDYVLSIMGIEHCRDTIVGDTRRKGISGGERKRLCIAMELLPKPRLLFLDEPTSGLDSSTSLSICRTLKKLSAMGECTVICTIHQPQQKIFELFDNLLLMKSGTIFYSGSAFKSLRYLETIGHPVPVGENPADHILNVISPKEQEDKIDTFVVPVDLSLGADKDSFGNLATSSWIRQFAVLFQRSFQQYYRKPQLIMMNLVITLVLATFVSQGIWNEIGTTQLSIPTRVPSLFFACVTQGIVASLQNVNSFPGERALVLRERASGMYGISAYFTAKTLVDFITQSWPPILFSVIVYPEIGYQPNVRKFFIYMMFMILDTMAATSIATAGNVYIVLIYVVAAYSSFVFSFVLVRFC